LERSFCLYGIHANAKMKASAPMEATSAWAMCVQVVIRSVIGVMSGRLRLGRVRRRENPAC
jgi:hypothetical protein